MTLGFSYVGLIYLLMLMTPNLLWTKHQPKEYERYAGKENRILLCFERAGEVLVTCIALIFSDFNIRPWTDWSWWLAGSFFLMLLYEVFSPSMEKTYCLPSRPWCSESGISGFT